MDINICILIQLQSFVTITVSKMKLHKLYSKKYFAEDHNFLILTGRFFFGYNLFYKAKKLICYWNKPAIIK